MTVIAYFELFPDKVEARLDQPVKQALDELGVVRCCEWGRQGGDPRR